MPWTAAQREKIQHVINYLAPTYSGHPPTEVRAVLDAELARRGLALDEGYRAEIVEAIRVGAPIIFNPQAD